MAPTIRIAARDATDSSCIWYTQELFVLVDDPSFLARAKATFVFKAFFSLAGLALFTTYIIQTHRHQKVRIMAPWYLFGSALFFWTLHWIFQLISSLLYGCYPDSWENAGAQLGGSGFWFYGISLCFLLATVLFPVSLELHRMVDSDSFRKVRGLNVFALAIVCLVTFSAHTYWTWRGYNPAVVPGNPNNYRDEEEEDRRERVQDQLFAALSILQALATFVAAGNMLWAWWQGRKLGGRCTLVHVCTVVFTVSLSIDFFENFADWLYALYPALTPYTTDNWYTSYFVTDTIADLAELVAFISILVLVSSRGMQPGRLNDKPYFYQPYIGDLNAQTAYGDPPAEPAPWSESKTYDPVNPGREYRSHQAAPSSPGPYNNVESGSPELRGSGETRRQSGLQRYYGLPTTLM